MSKKLANKADFGKGIRALLNNPQQLEKAVHDNPQEVVREFATNFAMIPVEQIKAYNEQPRKDFNDGALEELAASIRIHGIIQPITVRRIHDKEYQLISGERRFRASQRAGLTEIPAYVRLADDQQMLEMALIENIQREDLNPIEIAISYGRLLEEFKLTHESLSQRVGKERTTITNFLRLLRITDTEIYEGLRNRLISAGHGKALAGLENNKALQKSLFHKVVQEGLSVRALENIIASYNDERSDKKAKPDKDRLPEDLRNIQDQFSAFFGAKVKLKRDPKGKGQLLIAFNNDNELNRLLDSIEKK